ncbi:MAG TPA: ferredoxin [Candidatus Dormibacteraeota bacterium]
MSRKSYELWIDRTRCDGSALCAELAPELVRLDDWGYPIIAPGPVPDHLLEHARRAVNQCPVLALKLLTKLPDFSAVAPKLAADDRTNAAVRSDPD